MTSSQWSYTTTTNLLWNRCGCNRFLAVAARTAGDGIYYAGIMKTRVPVCEASGVQAIVCDSEKYGFFMMCPKILWRF